MRADIALATAQDLRAFLAPACQKTAIAGSLRRQQAEVHDIDLVVVPLYDQDLLGGEAYTYARLSALLNTLLREGRLIWDTEKPADGMKQKRFRVPELEMMVLELWIAQPANYGGILTIRTGSREFSEALVTPRKWKGLLPDWMLVRDGLVWKFPSVAAAMAVREAKKQTGRPPGATALDSSSEAAFFSHLRLQPPSPLQRNPEIVAQLRSSL